jgi:uncharacterized small protein (DUF1192 family)
MRGLKLSIIGDIALCERWLRNTQRSQRHSEEFKIARSTELRERLAGLKKELARFDALEFADSQNQWTTKALLRGAVPDGATSSHQQSLG